MLVFQKKKSFVRVSSVKIYAINLWMRFHHGEDPVKSCDDGDVEVGYHDFFTSNGNNTRNTNDLGINNGEEKFKYALEEGQIPLYEGCSKYSKLSSIVELYNLKTKHGWSDTGFNEKLELIKDMFLENNLLLSSIYLVNFFREV